MDGEVADYVASKEQNATPNSCDQQPPSTYFHLYTQGLTYTNPHSDTLVTVELLVTPLFCPKKHDVASELTS